MPTVASACPLDCPDACTLDVEVDAGRVVEIGGSHVNPLTDGYICAKVRRFPEHLYGPDRVLHPGIRTGKKGDGDFRRATWDEALALVASRMLAVRENYGGEAILPYSYGGSNGFFSQNTVDSRLFHRLGASRLDRTVCAAPTTAAAAGLYGRMPGVALSDYDHAKLILLWGVNPSTSGIHLIPHIYEAQRQGAALIVIDPIATPLAKRADIHLALKPGTDLPVALAMIRWLFETGRADFEFLEAHATGADRLRRAAEPWTFERAAREAEVAPDLIEKIARLYSERSPSALRCGWGLERNRNGGSAAASVLALPAVAGKFRVRGGGYTMSNSGAWKLDSERAAAAPAPATRRVNMNLLGEALTRYDNPPVKFLFVFNSNAAVTTPNQTAVLAGLSREDLFTVVFDAVMTDTARYADVVLPATTFLEHEELARGYGALTMNEIHPAIAPVGESRPNHDVFSELVNRAGVSDAGDPADLGEIRDALLAREPRRSEIQASLGSNGSATPDCGETPIQFVDTFPGTHDRKVHLFPDELDRESPAGLYGYRPDPATERFPLALVSSASDLMISSTLGELVTEPANLEIHPDDARPRSIRDGAGVRVWNELGSVECAARVSKDMRPGVVRLPKGLWRKHTRNGATATALAPDTLTDIGGGACFNDARVDVEPLP